MGRKAPHLAHRLRNVIGHLIRHLRAVGPGDGLTWSQSSILARLDRAGEQTAAALAAAEGVRPQSMSAAIDRLEADRLVARRADPADRRQVRIAISPHGLEVLGAARASREAWLATAIAAHLDRREQDVLAEAIALLERITEKSTRDSH